MTQINEVRNGKVGHNPESLPAALLRVHARWVLLAADLAESGLGPDEIRECVRERLAATSWTIPPDADETVPAPY